MSYQPRARDLSCQNTADREAARLGAVTVGVYSVMDQKSWPLQYKPFSRHYFNKDGGEVAMWHYDLASFKKNDVIQHFMPPRVWSKEFLNTIVIKRLPAAEELEVARQLVKMADRMEPEFEKVRGALDSTEQKFKSKVQSMGDFLGNFKEYTAFTKTLVDEVARIATHTIEGVSEQLKKSEVFSIGLTPEYLRDVARHNMFYSGLGRVPDTEPIWDEEDLGIEPASRQTMKMG